MSDEVIALVSETCEFLGDEGQYIGRVQGIAPRFALFHAPNSICSHKVRTVLAHHKIAYSSHSMNIPAGDTYFPGYVRLRLRACEQAGLPLVASHNGSTSASSQGCDPAVVPTLVDWDTGGVIIDSKKICLYLDALMDAKMSLYPSALRPEIDAELDSMDNLPNYQLMIGGLALFEAGVEQPVVQKGIDFSLAKVSRCDDYIIQYADAVDLLQAYEAKRAKELHAVQTLFSPDAVQGARDIVVAQCGRLNKLLDVSGKTWLLSNDFTMADIFWGIQLTRLHNVGLSCIWECGRLPHVERFFADVAKLDSIRTAILEWPGAI